MKLFDLSGRIALITGSSKGIGFALASALGAAGARVVLNARDATALTAARDALRAQGVAAEAVTFDVTDAVAVEAGIARIEAEIGPIEILVNNAGMQHRGSFAEFPIDAWRKITSTNIDSVFFVGRYVAQRMIERRRGKIINVSSQAGVIGQASHGAYAASKGGLNMLTKVMCVEWAKHNIQINSVCPTVILTPMGETVWGPPAKGDPMKAKIPAGRFGKPIEVADMILYLASSASDLVNGQDLLIDGGYTAV